VFRLEFDYSSANIYSAASTYIQQKFKMKYVYYQSAILLNIYNANQLKLFVGTGIHINYSTYPGNALYTDFWSIFGCKSKLPVMNRLDNRAVKGRGKYCQTF